MVSLSYPTRLLLAVLAYLAAYVLTDNVAWALRTPRPGRFGQAIETVRSWGTRLWLGDLLRLGYYVLVPYMVLYWGWASPLDLGLADLDWIRGIGLTLALGTGSALLLAFVWAQYARLVGAPALKQQGDWLEQPWGWAFLLREAILLESWFALCRAPLLLLAGPYFGVYLGLAAACLASLLNARTRHQLSTAGLREEVILSGSIALVTATLYAFLHNFWLCLALHFALRIIVLQVVKRGAKAALLDERSPS